MTDKAARYVVFVIKRFFERQKCEHQIGGSAYFENAFLSPRPDGRTDVMNGFDTLLFEVTFKSNIEVRRINTNKNIWLQFAKTLLSDRHEYVVSDADDRALQQCPSLPVLPFRTEASQPSACIRGPATPTKRALGTRSFRARIKPAPGDIAGGFSGDQGTIVNGRCSVINESDRALSVQRNR